MYNVYATTGSSRLLIYNDVTSELEQTKLIDPVLKLKDNTAGTFTAKIPIGNACYSTIQPMITTIDVYRDGSWLWQGRVLSIEKDFWLQKKITCEGALAYLNDTIAPLHKYSNVTISSFINSLLTIHNSKVGTNRKIYIGTISSSTSSGTSISTETYVTESESILSYINNVAKNWGLHIRLRMSSDNLYLDMLADTQLNMATQSINFGVNLLDYADNYDWSDFITVLHPLGAVMDTDKITNDDQYPDRVVIKSEPSDSNFSRDGEYLVNTSAVNIYGRIEATVEWQEIDDPDVLLILAELYLADYQYNSLEIKIKLFDLHYLTSSTTAFNFLDQINCYSRPHGLNATFIATEMSIPFDKPENTLFTFSRTKQGSYGSSDRSGSYGGKISTASADIVSKTAMMLDAKSNAYSMIDMATNGYVTLVPANETIDGVVYAKDRTAEIMITNNIDPDKATQRWRWNINGLMHQHRSSVADDWSPSGVDLALTMDGQIVATAITTGTFTVPDGQGGVLFQTNLDSHTCTIAGFTVSSTAIYNTKPSPTSSTVGVYIGNDGIGLGSANQFYVNISGGSVSAMLGGFTLTGNNGLYSNGRSSYSGGSGVHLSPSGIGAGDSNVFSVGYTGNSNKIAGFTFTDRSLYNSKSSLSSSTNGVYLGNDGIAIGSNNKFFVDVNSGTARIAGFDFDNSALYTNSRTSLTSSGSGVHLSGSGVSVSNGGSVAALTSGALRGYSAGNSSASCEVGFATIGGDAGIDIWGTRHVALHPGSTLYIYSGGSYYSAITTSVTVAVGIDTFTITNSGGTITGTLSLNYQNLYFKHGILTTVGAVF